MNTLTLIRIDYILLLSNVIIAQKLSNCIKAEKIWIVVKQHHYDPRELDDTLI